MMKKLLGFTIIELMIAIALVGMVGAILTSAVLNNRGATEKRAYIAAQQFIDDNNLDVERRTCAGDSDDDGYGSCALTLRDQRRIRLECPTGFFATSLFGATSCKEIFFDMNFGNSGGVPTNQ